MTPRPPTHREPTDEEMQRLPDGTLVWIAPTWSQSGDIGKKGSMRVKDFYAVPITKQEEEDPEVAKAIEAIKQAKAKGWKIRTFFGPSWMEVYAQIDEDAMLAARNNQPEKV